MGDNDAVIAGFEAEVLGTNVVCEDLDGGTRVQDYGALLRIAEHLVGLGGDAALLRGVHALTG